MIGVTKLTQSDRIKNPSHITQQKDYSHLFSMLSITCSAPKFDDIGTIELLYSNAS